MDSIITLPKKYHPSHYTDVQIAQLLGVVPTSVRRWRTQNKAFGAIKHGPPYEYRGSRVVYPRQAFEAWCQAVHVDATGVARINVPVTAHVEAPKVKDAKRIDTRQLSLPVDVPNALV